MKVKELIKRLKKMPQNLEVGYAHQDNSAFEIAGYCENVWHEKKIDFDPKDDVSADEDMINDQPDEWVIIRA